MKYGYLVGISKYRNAGSPPVCRGKDGVGEKREYARMQGYLDAKSRHSKDSLNVSTETIWSGLCPLCHPQGSSDEYSYGWCGPYSVAQGLTCNCPKAQGSLSACPVIGGLRTMKRLIRWLAILAVDFVKYEIDG